METIFLLAFTALILAILVIKKNGLISVFGLIVVKDVVIFGVLALVLFTINADSLVWHPLANMILTHRTNSITEYSILSFVFLLVFILIYSRFMRKNGFPPDEVLKSAEVDRLLGFGFAIILVSFVINFLIYGPPNQFAYFSDAAEAAITRSIYGATSRSNPFLSYLDNLIISPLLIFLSYKIVFSYERFLFARKFFALASLLGIFIIITWEGQKAPFVAFVTFLVVVRSFSEGGFSTGLKLIGFVGVIFFVVSVVNLYQLNDAVGIFTTESDLFIRLVAQPFGVYFYDLMPDYFSAENIIYESLPAAGFLKYLIDGVSLETTSRLMIDILHPGSETSGVMNTYYFGQGLVVFGYYGAFFSSLAVCISVIVILFFARKIAKKWRAYGNAFVTGYLGVYIIALSGDLTPYLFSRIAIQCSVNLILMSIFWRLVTYKTAFRAKGIAG